MVRERVRRGQEVYGRGEKRGWQAGSPKRKQAAGEMENLTTVGNEADN